MTVQIICFHLYKHVYNTYEPKKKEKRKRSASSMYSTRAQDSRELYSAIDKSGTFSPMKVEPKCISSIKADEIILH